MVQGKRGSYLGGSTVLRPDKRPTEQRLQDGASRHKRWARSEQQKLDNESDRFNEMTLAERAHFYRAKWKSGGPRWK